MIFYNCHGFVKLQITVNGVHSSHTGLGMLISRHKPSRELTEQSRDEGEGELPGTMCRGVNQPLAVGSVQFVLGAW